MKTLLILLAVAGFAAARQNNTLTSAEKSQGWQLLFDGKSLSGWEPRSTSAPGTNGDWSVADAAIMCPGTSAGWLSSTPSFTDFHLKLQFRGAEKVNSGVFLRSRKDGQPHITGYELQIWDYQPAGYNTGSLVGSVKADPVKIRADQWNDYDITAEGDHYTIVLNGAKVLDTRANAHASGVIGFQCQVSNKIEFRNVRIRPTH